MKMKVVLCFGTRPEAIKMAPVYHELKKLQIEVIVCVSAQHREMLDQVLEFFQIKPDFDLNLMKPDQSLNNLSSDFLRDFDLILGKIKPDLVLVQGDTTTAFVAAFAAFNQGIKVGHIEAGLRTYNKKAPFPEEGNRQLISRISDFHFVPTVGARNYLLNEGVSEKSILLSGNTVIDALKWSKERFSEGFTDEGIQDLEKRLDPLKKLILITGHRRENLGSGMERICEALKELSQRDDVQLIFPVHLNPKVKDVVNSRLGGEKQILLTGPVNYPTFLWLLQRCVLVISDSGGIQEEAPSFQKPVLVTREVSERMEGVELGLAFLVGTDKGEILGKANELLDLDSNSTVESNPYGDGKASRRIAEFLLAEAGNN